MPAIVLALTTALAAAGCGSVDTGSGANGTREVSDVKHFGIKVPEKPKRVVTLSEPTLDAALALGINPVGTVAARGLPVVPPYLADKAKDVPVVSAVGNPDAEKIAATKPDLILTDGTSLGSRPDALEILQKIAPVVYAGHAGGDWKAHLEIVGNALNKADEAQELVTEYEKKAEEVKARVAPNYGDKTFSVVRWQGGGPGLILKELLAGRALSDVGLHRPLSQDKEGPGHSVPVATEQLSDIDADYMFFGTLGGSSQSSRNVGGASDVEAARAAIEKARQTPGFNDLAAVKGERVVPVDGYWTSAGGPILMGKIIDDINAALK